MDISKVALASSIAALKVVASGVGTITAPAATLSNSPQSNLIVIPHNQIDSNVIPSVIINTSALYGYNSYTQIPFSTPDGRTAIDTYVDNTNVYIKATNSTAGSPQSSMSFPYTISIIIP